MNDKHHGPHCAGSCEGAAYVIELQRLRAENKALREAYGRVRAYIGQSQPVPGGWCVDLEPTGHIVMRSPDGDFAVINPPEHEATRLAVVSQFLATMLAAAPKPGAAHDRGEK